jgi:hypothetical protein
MLNPKVGDYVMAYSDCEAKIPYETPLKIISIKNGKCKCVTETTQQGIKHVTHTTIGTDKILRIFTDELQADYVSACIRVTVRKENERLLKLHNDSKDYIELLIKEKT